MPGAVVPGEFELIAEFFAPLAGEGAFGLMDDAASLELPAGQGLVVTKDMIVEGVHFFGHDAPASIARKALGVNLSDLAAKGARPLGFLLGFGRTGAQTRGWCADFAQGLSDMARESGCPLLGGDTVSTSTLTLSITAFGTVPAGRMLKRQGGAPGDLLYVSGTIGDAALGLKLRLEPEAGWVKALEPAHRASLLDRYLHPRPRLALREALLTHASAAMDVSDGLVGDADKLARHLGKRFSIPKAPLSPAARAAIALEPLLLDLALTGGDDYEILAAVPPDRAASFEAAALQSGIEVTQIGVIGSEDEETRWLDALGQPRFFLHRSYTHE